MPKPPIAQPKNVAHSGQPAASTGTLAARPKATMAKPQADGAARVDVRVAGR